MPSLPYTGKQKVKNRRGDLVDRYPIREIKCDQCGAEIITRVPHKKFCSKHCAKKHKYWRDRAELSFIT